MSKVDFQYRDGRAKAMPEAHAKILSKLGRGTYQTRDMVAAPVQQVMRTAPVAAPVGEFVISAPDGQVVLDGLDREQLHELAERLGVKVHPLAGVVRVRAALQDAFPA